MKNLYKTRQRKGRNIEVCFNFEPTKWISTGTTDQAKALLFISQNYKTAEIKNDITFKEYLQDFINNNFLRVLEYDKKHGKEKKQIYYFNLASITKKYIFPILQNCIIQKLNFSELAKKIETAEGSNLTKNRIIETLKIIYKFTTLDNLTTENLANKLENYKYEPTEKAIFTKEELNKLFNRNNFTSEKWELYFMMLRDTGWRPSEIASLKYSDIRENGAISTSESVVYDGKKAKLQNTIKTSKKGQPYKIGILKKDTLFLFEKLNKKTDELIFIFNSRLLLTQTANRELIKASKKADIKLNGRTQYSFRHSFNTQNYYLLDTETRHELMGHMHERPEYLHLTIEDRLNNLLSDEKTLKVLSE